MRTRYYEAASGRYVSEDPSAQGKNYYVFVSNNPVFLVDYSGKSEGSIDGKVWVIISGVCVGAGLLLGEHFGFLAFKNMMAQMIKDGNKGATQDAFDFAIECHDNIVEMMATGAIGELAGLGFVEAAGITPGVGGALACFGIGFAAGLLIGFNNAMYESMIQDMFNGD
jgi:hypothetical protein